MPISVFLVIWLFIGAVVGPVNTFAGPCSPESFMNSNLHVRSQVRHFLDQLKDYSLVAVGHTTDSLSMNKGNTRRSNKLPQYPKAFPAGFYKVIFKRADQVKAVLVQTENKVGHYVTVIPGKTDIGGYVQIIDDPNVEEPSGLKLNNEELDYFVRTVYSRFCKALHNDEYEKLNSLKDMLLAILFSAKPGLQEYHRNLLHIYKWE